MTRMLRIVAGADAPGAKAAAAALALRLVDHARARGLRLVRMEMSRVIDSRSRYLVLGDAQGREWLVRVSNHFLPRRSGHLEPHVDFVSLDGTSGLDRAEAAIGRIARGEMVWWAPQRRPCARRQR